MSFAFAVKLCLSKCLHVSVRLELSGERRRYWKNDRQKSAKLKPAESDIDHRNPSQY